MTLSADLAAAAAVLEGWTATEVRPANPSGWTPPAKTGSPTAPAAWLAYALTYTGSELADFGGGEVRQGLFELVIFVEPGVGDARARELMDLLAAQLRSGSTLSFTILAPRPAAGETVMVGDEAWEGWPVVADFIAQN